MTSDREDHSDLESLFGEDQSCDEHENDRQATRPPCSVISLPRAATVLQNVGTIAPFPVPVSSEHHSSGCISSASIPLMRNSVEPQSRPEARGKRNASPQPGQSNKKRRVESDSAPNIKTRATKQLVGEPTDLRRAVLQKRTLTSGSDASGLPTSTECVLAADALQAARNLLAPRTSTPRSRLKNTKGRRKTVPSTTVASGTGSAADPVVIPGDTTSSAPTLQSNQNPAQPTSRRLTRSQEAHALLEALPTDPTDVLSQTLRTILKTPTTISHSRNNTPRDIAVYLANGRFTGTPFLRLLRHLAGPDRLKDTKTGLEWLKKLVEAMRTMEEASKPAAPSQSSAASTPVPVTPDTPSVTSFPAAEPSTVLHPSGLGFEQDLFTYSGVSFDVSASAPVDLSKQPQPSSDIVIDPQLLALDQNQIYSQTAPSDAPNLDLNLDGLLGALPPPPLPDSGLDLSTIDMEGTAGAMDLVGWEELCNMPLDLDALCPMPTPSMFQRPFTSATQITQRVPKQSDLPPGGIRIPARTEALALLERARARKAELQAKIKSARRQAWGCMVEAA
ncbi:hypothetical protein FRC07_003548, partial [Ceratobasidium sp. 392]